MVLGFALCLTLAQGGPPPLPSRDAPLTPPPPPVTPVPAPAPATPSFVRVKCPQDCSVRASGGTGRRVSPQLWEFSDVAPGKVRFDIEGFATIPIASGYLDVPAGSDVEVLVSRNRLTLGTVTARAAPPPTLPTAAPATAPGLLRLSCQKPCTVLVDGQRRTGENQLGQLTVSNVTPGTRQVYVKFIGGSAQSSIEVAPDTEVFIVAQESGLRVTNTKPLH